MRYSLCTFLLVTVVLCELHLKACSYAHACPRAVCMQFHCLAEQQMAPICLGGLSAVQNVQ